MRTGGASESWKVLPLDPNPATLHQVPSDAKMHVGNPSVLTLASGRVLVAFDQQGPGVADTTGTRGRLVHFNHWVQGKLFASADHGQSWQLKTDFPFCSPCLFRDGSQIYIIGHRGNVQIMRSSDGGETWGKPTELTGKEGAEAAFVLGPPNVLLADGRLYLIFMRLADLAHKGDASSVLAPVILHAPQGTDLTARRSWTLIESLPTFRDLVSSDSLDGFGVPFFDVPDPRRGTRIGGDRWANRIGWGAAHLLRIVDPVHVWHPAAGRAFHLLARATTHRSNLAVLARLVEDDAGAMRLDLETAPSGRRAVFLPLPGGNLDFHVVYDDVGKLYWLAGNQVTDSMTRADKTPRQRHGLPADDNQRLQLCYSRNLVDWCFAGYLEGGANPGDSRQTPRMAMHGGDLYVAACAANPDARSSQYADSIRCYRVPGFRELIY